MNDELTDSEVVRRIRTGESALFELIMRRHNRRLFRMARGILGNDAEAEDAVQDGYVAAYYKLPQFRGPDGFASWLHRIVLNHVLMRRRASSRVHLKPIESLEDSVASAEIPERSPEGALHTAQMTRLLEIAIDRVPQVYRDAFVLREVEQLSLAEAAEILGIPPGTVKTRAHRARRVLQKSLSTEMRAALTGLYDFDGARCDRMVSCVLERISALAS